jgi:hypothetical protein
MTQSLLEMYAAELMRVQEKDARKGSPRTPSGNGGWKEKEWSPQDIAEFKMKIDKLGGEYHGCTRLNMLSSSEHIANILYRSRYRHKIPDECWEYMVLKVDYYKELIPEEDECWEFRDIDGWWAHWEIRKAKAAYWKHRSRKMTRVKSSEVV